jgi:hypothetical protein
MKTELILTLIFIFFSLSWPIPMSYELFRLNSQTEVDGNISDWPEEYFIDSIRNDENVFIRDSSIPWHPDEFQMRLYGGHKIYFDTGHYYFYIKVIRDDRIITGHGDGFDNITITRGGDASKLHLYFDGSHIEEPACPLRYGRDIIAAIDTGTSQKCPSFEFAIDIMNLDAFNTGQFILSIGAEDHDDSLGNDRYILGFGVEKTGDKHEWNANPFDNPSYYPTFHVLDSIPLALQKRELPFLKESFLKCYPNPFNSFIQIILPNTKANAVIRIYTVSGKLIESFQAKTSHTWHPGTLPNGVYILKANIRQKTFSKKLLLNR